MGKTFTGMTIAEEPNVNINNDFQYLANFFPENSTYDVTNFATGPYIEIIKTVLSRLNASITLYKRNDENWGVFKNGKWNGIYKNLVDGQVDILVASLIQNIDRSRVRQGSFLKGI